MTNDFKVFAPSATNITSISDYLASSVRTNGVSSGTASSALANRSWRQASIMAAMLGDFLGAAGYDAIDDGTTATLLASFQSSISTLALPTGTIRLGFFIPPAPTGWIIIDDGSIGDASSGATTRANADCQALFTAVWTRCSNTWAPIQDSSGSATTRGGSAASDWGAHRRLVLPKILGRSLAVAGAGSGLTSRSVGAFLGEETHQLTIPEMPSHHHSGSPNDVDGQGGGSAYYNRNGNTGDTGGDQPHNNMQPTVFLDAMIKL